MGKKLIGIAVAALMLFGIFGLSGCNKHKVYEDGYFQYVVLGENSIYLGEDSKAIAIVGFTKLGKEQEVIDLPRIIDGKPVIMVGTRIVGFDNSNRFYSEKLKKIYIHDNIQQIVYFEGQEVDAMLCSLNIDLFRETTDYKPLTFFKNIYVYESVNQNNNLLSANIIFLNNYSAEVNGGYYRLDNIVPGEKISKPPNPERTGYEFVGWFTESSCINAWDFDSSKEITSGTEFSLYAGWRAI